MKTIAHKVLGAFHMLLGIVSLVFLAVNPDPQGFQAWGALSVAFLAMPVLFFAIGSGLWLRRRGVRWLIAPLVVLIVLFTLLLLAGSVLWPESFAAGIMAVGAAFIALEIAALVIAGTFKKQTTEGSS